MASRRDITDEVAASISCQDSAARGAVQEIVRAAISDTMVDVARVVDVRCARVRDFSTAECAAMKAKIEEGVRQYVDSRIAGASHPAAVKCIDIHTGHADRRALEIVQDNYAKLRGAYEKAVAGHSAAVVELEKKRADAVCHADRVKAHRDELMKRNDALAAEIVPMRAAHHQLKEDYTELQAERDELIIDRDAAAKALAGREDEIKAYKAKEKALWQGITSERATVAYLEGVLQNAGLSY